MENGEFRLGRLKVRDDNKFMEDFRELGRILWKLISWGVDLIEIGKKIEELKG